jgi:hypothetical protein
LLYDLIVKRSYRKLKEVKLELVLPAKNLLLMQRDRLQWEVMNDIKANPQPEPPMSHIL